MRLLLCVATAALLIGCQSSDERQTASCLGYGYAAGTEQFAQCKMMLDMQERQQRAERQRQWDAENAARQLEYQRQAATPSPGSLLAAPQATKCGWEAGYWICRPTW